MARTGRTPELTPDVLRKVVYALTNASYRQVAAQYAGISARTMQRWMVLGLKTDKKNEKYRKFRRAVLNAEKASEVDTIAIVVSSRDPKHLLDLAGRRWPQRWGKDTLQLKNLTKAVSDMQTTIANLQAMLAARGVNVIDDS